jgi:hypothetical protein
MPLVINGGGTSVGGGGGPLIIAQGTTLPSGPADGREYYWEVDAVNGVVWHMRYDVTLNKWLFLGGADFENSVFTNETRNVASYAALTTAGPQLAVPAAGVYDVFVGFYGSSSTVNLTLLAAVDGAGQTANDNDAAFGVASTASTSFESARSLRLTLTAATLTTLYKVGAANSGNFNRRFMRIRPVAITPT